METHKATIVRGESNVTLTLSIKGNSHDILLTEDKPNEVKNVFNKLIEELKNGVFNFILEEDTKQDLYYHTSKEYLIQLNSELTSVFNELKDYDLLNKK